VQPAAPPNDTSVNLRGSDAAPDGDDLDALGHVGVDDLGDAFGGGEPLGAERAPRSGRRPPPRRVGPSAMRPPKESCGRSLLEKLMLDIMYELPTREDCRRQGIERKCTARLSRAGGQPYQTDLRPSSAYQSTLTTGTAG